MDGPDGYQYDLFVSYCRDEEVHDWVHRHFVPVLRQKLLGERGHHPAIFVDVQMEAGSRWPDELAWALHRSKLLLAVLTPRYFHSDWCQAEWQAFQLRQKLLKIGPGSPHRPLVYPIRFSDCEVPPPEVGQIQQGMCFKEYCYPDRQFADSPRFLDFRDHVRGLAQQLVPRLDDPPEWDGTWPVDPPHPGPPIPTPILRPVL